MSTITGEITDKTKLLRFVWQLVLLLVSLYVMTLGVTLCVRPYDRHILLSPERLLCTGPNSDIA